MILTPDKLARISVLNEDCECTHQGWVHTPEGCVGQNPHPTNMFAFTACECTVTTEQHITARMSAGGPA